MFLQEPCEQPNYLTMHHLKCHLLLYCTYLPWHQPLHSSPEKVCSSYDLGCLRFSSLHHVLTWRMFQFLYKKISFNFIQFKIFATKNNFPSQGFGPKGHYYGVYVKGQIKLLVNFDFTTVYSQFPFLPSPRRQRKYYWESTRVKNFNWKLNLTCNIYINNNGIKKKI